MANKYCSPEFGLLYDTANIFNSYGKEFGILNEEWLDIIGKYIGYFHAKGCISNENGNRTGPINGEGDVFPWETVLNYFRNMKVSDFIAPAPEPLFFTVETHYNDGKKTPWNDPKSPTSICLANLCKLVYNL